MSEAKILLTAEDQTKGAFQSVKSAVQDLRSSVGGLQTSLMGIASAVGAVSLASFVQNTIQATATLRDLGIQAGMSVEQLSALAAVGKATGTGADLIASASNKLAKSLATSTEESKGAAAALKALGLNFDTFQKLSPDQRIQQIALAMGQFHDGSQKSAAAMLLFGKAGAEVLPFLKDLAQTGELHAKVTTEQAEAAHQYEVALGKLKTQTDAWKKSLALELLPTLADITEELLKVRAASDGVGVSLLGAGIKTVFETIAALGVNVVYVLKQTSVELGGIAAQIGAILSGQLSRLPEIRRMMQGDAQEARRQVDQSTYNILGITNSKAGAGRSDTSKFTDPRLLGAIPDFHKDLTGLEGDPGAAAAAEGQKQYDALIKRVKERIAQEDLEIAMGRKLSDQEQFEVKVRTDLADLMGKYPGLSKGVVDALVGEARARSDRLAVQASELQSNTLYAKDWSKTEQELSDFEKARTDERDRLLKSLADERRGMQDGNEMLKLEAQLMGATDKEREIELGQLKIQLDLKKQLEEIDRNRMLTPAARDLAKQQAQDNADLAKQQVAMRAGLNEQIRIWGTIDQTAHDVFVNMFERGSDTFKKLRDTLKATLLDLLYQMTVRKWLIQIVASVTGNGGIGGIVGQAAGSALGGSGGLIGNALGSFGGLGSIGSQFLSGSMSGANAAGTVYANATGTGLDGLLASNGAYGTAAEVGGEAAAAYGVEAGAGAAASTAAASELASLVPVVGWVVGIAALLYSVYGKKGGGPKVDGTSTRYLGGLGLGEHPSGSDDAANAAADSLQAQYNKLVDAFSGSRMHDFGLGFTMDPRGTAQTGLEISATDLAGNQAFSMRADAGRSQEDLQKAIAQLTGRALVKGLQDSNIPGQLGAWLKSLGNIDALSAGALDAATTRLQKVLAEKQSLEDQYWVLTHTEQEVTDRARKAEIDALDESNRSLGERVQALKDEKAMQDKLTAAAASYRAYLDKLNGTPAGLLSPEQQLVNSRSQFDAQFIKAQGGDSDALQNLTGYADQLISAQTAVSASSKATQDLIEYVKQALAQVGAPQVGVPLSDFWIARIMGSGLFGGQATNSSPFAFTFADGGDHAGGLRLVGERGPELEATGPSRIFNAQQTRQILSGGDSGRVEAAIHVLTDRVDRLTAIAAAGARGTIDSVEKVARNTDGTSAALLHLSKAPV